MMTSVMMSFSQRASSAHLQVQFRGFRASDAQIWHEGAKDSADLKCNIKIKKNKAVIYLESVPLYLLKLVLHNVVIIINGIWLSCFQI